MQHFTSSSILRWQQPDDSMKQTIRITLHSHIIFIPKNIYCLRVRFVAIKKANVKCELKTYMQMYISSTHTHTHTGANYNNCGYVRRKTIAKDVEHLKYNLLLKLFLLHA